MSRVVQAITGGAALLRAALGRVPGKVAWDPAQVRLIRVIRVDGLGDVVMTTPVLEALRQAFPAARIEIVVQPFVAGLLAASPFVDAVRTYAPGRRSRRDAPRLAWRAYRASLSWPTPDLVVSPRLGRETFGICFLALFSGARWRLAWAKPHPKPGFSGEALHDRCFTMLPPRPGAVMHEVAANLALLEALGIRSEPGRIRLWPGNGDKEQAAGLLATHGIHDKGFVVMAPGASDAFRRWPPERFAALADRLRADPGLTTMLVGGAEDKPLAAAVNQAAATPCVDLTGATPLGTLAALLEHAALFVGNDSGPLHMAVAAGRPVIELSAFPLNGPPEHQNSTYRFGPWGVPHRVLQPETPRPPCRASCEATEPHCIELVGVEAAHQAALGLLAA